MDVIKYQCSHCNTLYDSADRCPTCGSLSEDAIQINHTQNIKSRKNELALETYFTPIYQLLCVVHLLTCLSWFGLYLSIPVTILHLIRMLKMKKKPNILNIIDMVVCFPSTLAMIAVLIFEIFPLDFFFF